MLMQGLGNMLILLGIVFVAVGAALSFGIRIPFLGRLPGDIVIRREGAIVYVPITSALLVSVFFGVLSSFLQRIR